VIEEGYIRFEFPKKKPEEWPEHNHSLDWCDRQKINKAVRDALFQEVVKGYEVASILKMFTGEWQKDNRIHLERCGGKHLSLKHIHNVGRDFRKQNKSKKRYGNQEEWEQQLATALRFLQQEESWFYRQISAIRNLDSEQSNALVFAERDRIKTLCRRGYLTLMDSTHCTNKLGWFLFTLVVRDEQGSYIPCAHFLTDNEDGDIIAAALKVVKEWTGGTAGWRLRWMLTDDSAAEQRGVRLAFDNEDECVGHLLCTKHSGNTLDRNLSGPNKKEARKHMYTAMYTRKTRIGCQDSVQQAIDSLPSEKDKAYLRNNWYNSLDSWAMCVRSHSCILLQVSIFPFLVEAEISKV
jgi:hypothetical protein